MKRSCFFWLLLSAMPATLFFSSNVFAQSAQVDFDSESWSFIDAEVAEHLGRKALSGTAVLEGVSFENGVIEVDIAVTGERSYPGILFRFESMQNHERFYIRPHRAGLYPDALQYTPAINGISGWQLYHGDGFTAAAEIPAERWIHFRFEISGRQMRIFQDNAEHPALVVNDLKRGVRKGSIGVQGPRDGTAYFSNFMYDVDASIEMESAPERTTPYGMLTAWELSRSFKTMDIDLEAYPAEQALGDLGWQKVEAEPSGLVDIAFTCGRTGRAADSVFARTVIQSDGQKTMTLQFGYSDAVSIFINKQLVFSGNSAYRQRDPSFLGIVGLNDTVYLPLNEGENELLMIVSEVFGGWGFICRDGQAVFQHEKLNKEWELADQLRVPESVAYDPVRQRLYVSNLQNGGMEFVSKITLDGKIEELEWVTGLRMPTGLCVDRDRLYVVDRSGLNEIEIETGKILNRYTVPEARFINDVAADGEGQLFISDNGADRIYRLGNGKCEVWLEGGRIVNPNGLLWADGRLLVGTSGDGCLKSVDPADKSIVTIASFGRGSIMDGLRSDGRGRYFVSDYSGRVFQVSPEGEKVKILDRTAPQQFCADFEYIPDKNLLIIPSLYANRLTAYRWNP